MLEKIKLDKDNRMLRIGFGKHEGKWFFRVDLWFVGYRFKKKPKRMGITREQIKEMAEYVFKEQPKERKVKFYRGCLERGWVSTEIFSHCGNENCAGCNMMKKAIQDEININTFKPYDGNKRFSKR